MSAAFWMHVQNDFEAWARVADKLLQRTPEEQRALLRALSIERAFALANEHWSATLRADLRCRRYERPQRFGRLCAEELARRSRMASRWTMSPS